jgi:hypothetical protein
VKIEEIIGLICIGAFALYFGFIRPAQQGRPMGTDGNEWICGNHRCR